MANPKQMGFFENIHPVRAMIEIKKDHELLRLAKVIPWRRSVDVLNLPQIRIEIVYSLTT